MGKKKIEILAPAGSYDAMVAAVRSGADAVYLGAKALNARRNATNFEDEQLFQAVEYCHVRNVKVHLTLNTLMYDHEVTQVEQAIHTLSKAGVDAVIVQDLGVMAMMQQIAPHIPLHASTQMALHNLEGVRLAQQLGFSRVVLARELSKEEIAYIAANTSLELEVFVHGALCMSVSGQCYLSSMLGERSGNRGLCAQPCRLPFQVEQGNPYGLSLKDLSLADAVRELEQLGVASVKIEGRMKRPEYVAAAVGAVKNAYDNLPVDYTALRSVFSRSGFTNGYYSGQCDSSMFGTRQKEDVMAASSVLKELEQSYSKEQPLVPLKMHLILQENQPLSLTCEDDKGNVVVSKGDFPQVAQTKPTTLDKAKQSLEKTGGTPYYLASITGDIQDGFMVPASQLNALRREALEEITLQRGKRENHLLGEYIPPKLPKVTKESNPKLRVRLCTLQQFFPDMLEKAEQVILPLGELLRFVKQGGELTEKFCGELPSTLYATGYCRESLKKLQDLGLKHVHAATLWGVELAKELGFTNIHGGFAMNIFNEEALCQMKKLGVLDAELSFELNLNKVSHMSRPFPVGVVAYGYLPLMTLRNCPVSAEVGCDNCKGVNKIRDRKGIDFYIQCEQGLSKLYNSVPLYMADRMKELTTDFATLYFTIEKYEEVLEVWQRYLEGRPPEKDITRGLYYRNVQ